MIKKLSEIATAYTNLIRSNLKLTSEQEEELANKRMAVCNSCEFQSSINTCKKCGCFLPAKTKNRESQCPLKLW